MADDAVHKAYLGYDKLFCARHVDYAEEYVQCRNNNVRAVGVEAVFFHAAFQRQGQQILVQSAQFRRANGLAIPFFKQF